MNDDREHNNLDRIIVKQMDKVMADVHSFDYNIATETNQMPYLQTRCSTTLAMVLLVLDCFC